MLQSLAADYEFAASGISAPGSYKKLPQFQQLVDLGLPIVPFILHQIANGNCWSWSAILHEINANNNGEELKVEEPGKSQSVIKSWRKHFPEANFKRLLWESQIFLLNQELYRLQTELSGIKVDSRMTESDKIKISSLTKELKKCNQILTEMKSIFYIFPN